MVSVGGTGKDVIQHSSRYAFDAAAAAAADDDDDDDDVEDDADAGGVVQNSDRALLCCPANDNFHGNETPAGRPAIRQCIILYAKCRTDYRPSDLCINAR